MKLAIDVLIDGPLLRLTSSRIDLSGPKYRPESGGSHDR
jgi:hypothetical protein